MKILIILIGGLALFIGIIIFIILQVAKDHK